MSGERITCPACGSHYVYLEYWGEEDAPDAYCCKHCNERFEDD